MLVQIEDHYTSAWLKSTFLAGIILTDDDGQPLPDELFDRSIKAAIESIERTLDLHLSAVSFKNERHDAYEPNRDGWWPFELDNTPVRSITAVSLQYGSYNPTSVPLSWILMRNPVLGSLQLVPSTENIGSYFHGQGVPLFFGSVLAPVSYMPGYFAFDYDVGFPIYSGTTAAVTNGETIEVTLDSPWIDPKYDITLTIRDSAGAVAAGSARVTLRSNSGFSFVVSGLASSPPYTVDWVVDTVPASMRRVIGLVASMLPLDVAGDLILGAGIATLSTSVDGLSQSIGTTSSATNAGYGARVKQFERELKSLMEPLKNKYRPFRMAVV